MFVFNIVSIILEIHNGNVRLEIPALITIRAHEEKVQSAHTSYFASCRLDSIVTHTIVTHTIGRVYKVDLSAPLSHNVDISCNINPN